MILRPLPWVAQVFRTSSSFSSSFCPFRSTSRSINLLPSQPRKPGYGSCGVVPGFGYIMFMELIGLLQALARVTAVSFIWVMPAL